MYIKYSLIFKTIFSIPRTITSFQNQLYKHVFDLTREEKVSKKSLYRDLS